MKLVQAKELLAEFRPGSLQISRVSRPKRRAARFAAFVRENAVDWPDEERRFVRTSLVALLEEVLPDPSEAAQPFGFAVATSGEDARPESCGPPDVPICPAVTTNEL